MSPSKKCCNNKIDCSSISYLTLLFSLTVQILIGISILILSENVKYSLGKILHEIQRNELNIRLFLNETYAIHLIVFYTCGYPLAIKCTNDSYTTHLKLLLKFWNAIIIMISIEGVVTSWLSITSFRYVEESIKNSLYRGIDVYHMDTMWRLLWDTLQFGEQCCGVIDYKDWEAMTWKEYKLNDNDTALADFKYVSMTPYSCCKIQSTCYKNVDYSTQDINTIESFPKPNVTSINHSGCLPLLVDRIELVLNTSIILCCIVVIFQVFILIAMDKLFKLNRCYVKNCEQFMFPTPRSIDRYDEEKLIKTPLDFEVCDFCQNKISNTN